MRNFFLFTVILGVLGFYQFYLTPTFSPIAPILGNLDKSELPIDTNINNLFPTIPETLYDSIFYMNQGHIADGFDFPVGAPNGDNYFRALKFGQRLHLGEDWNGRKGGNSDLGDPVYSIGNGLVTFVEDVCCGWGNVVRVVHRLPNHPEYKFVESVFAHMQDVYVRPGQLLRRGQELGTIGTANGRYKAHLHLELRSFINMSLGPGYAEDNFGYLSPSEFIKENRPTN